MLAKYLPYIFGTASCLLGFYLLLISSKFYKPNYKIKEQDIKYIHWLTKFEMLMKFSSIALILNGGYNLLNPNPDRYRISMTNKKDEWTIGAKDTLIRKCIRDGGPTAVKYPQLGKEYCECSVGKIMKSFTQEQYEKSSRKPQEEQIKELLPVFQDCINELRHKIDSTENKH